MAAAITPRNFTFSCAAGVEPIQYPVFKSVIAWPETDSAVHTMPAIAITKNMPVVPETPNRNSTTDEMMMVSMVMPETGLRAVVAIAFAATEVKKKENTQRQHQLQCRPPSTIPADGPRNAPRRSR